MKRKIHFVPVTAIALVAIISLAFTGISPDLADGATQISGIAYWPNSGECNDPEGAGSDYAVRMTGDLDGCQYTFVESATCTPSGAYNESGNEIFVGQYNGGTGTFRTTYRFTAKYVDCENYVEVVGRCQHPLIMGSGEGIFEDMTGRLDFKDDLVAGNFPYRGHLR